MLKPYQAARLTLEPDADPGGITYNLDQSITAVGSGGLTGRGVVEASQTRLDYLPEHATDFAFASLAEQRGFVGCAILLLLYLLVVWRGLRVITGASRPVRRRRRRRPRRRVPLPGVRQRRHDHGRGAGHRDPAAVRHRRRLVDGREPRADRRAAEHPRARRARAAGAVSAAGRRQASLEGRRPRGARSATSRARPAGAIVVSGMLAEQLAQELGAGAEPGAVVVRRRGSRHGRRSSCASIAGDPSPEDDALVRAAARGDVPVVIVQLWPQADWTRPFVLSPFVVECRAGEGFPIGEIADRIVEAAEDAPALAARVPALRTRSRRHVVTQRVVRAALLGLLGASRAARPAPRARAGRASSRAVRAFDGRSLRTSRRSWRPGCRALLAGASPSGGPRATRGRSRRPLVNAAVAAGGTWRSPLRLQAPVTSERSRVLTPLESRASPCSSPERADGDVRHRSVRTGT